MTKGEAKRLLAAYRLGDQDRLDFAEALQKAEQDGELARWIAEEREFDRAVAAHLGWVLVRLGLRRAFLPTLRPGLLKNLRGFAPLPPAAPHTFLLLALFFSGCR